MPGQGVQNIEEILAQAKPKTVTVRACLRGDLLAEHDELERELAEARRLDESELRHAEAPHIAEKLQELEREIDQAATEFTFTAIGQKAWSDLLAQHLPTEEERELRYEFNRKSFPQAAIAASATDPQISPDQAHKLYAALNFGQWQQIWRGCLDANVEGTSVPFSAAASVILRGSETKSDSPTL